MEHTNGFDAHTNQRYKYSESKELNWDKKDEICGLDWVVEWIEEGVKQDGWEHEGNYKRRGKELLVSYKGEGIMLALWSLLDEDYAGEPQMKSQYKL